MVEIFSSDYRLAAKRACNEIFRSWLRGSEPDSIYRLFNATAKEIDESSSHFNETEIRLFEECVRQSSNEEVVKASKEALHCFKLWADAFRQQIEEIDSELKAEDV